VVLHGFWERQNDVLDPIALSLSYSYLELFKHQLLSSKGDWCFCLSWLCYFPFQRLNVDINVMLSSWSYWNTVPSLYLWDYFETWILDRKLVSETHYVYLFLLFFLILLFFDLFVHVKILLWHLQVFLQYTIIEFTSSIIHLFCSNSWNNFYRSQLSIFIHEYHFFTLLLLSQLVLKYNFFNISSWGN
jgi:hypothetical protein